MGENIRVGLVGCGRVAERGYVPALAAASTLDLVAVADVDQSRCAQVAPGAPSFRSAAELVAETPIDLLVVATPAASHVGDAEAASRAGVHALVEKPPAPTVAAAERLAKLEPEPWIGFCRRFEPSLVAARERVRAMSAPGGLVVELAIDARAWGSYAGSDGPLLDLGSHAADLVLWITDERVESVRVRDVGAASIAFDIALETWRASVTVAHDRAWRERVVVEVDGQSTVVHAAGGTLGRVRSRLGLGGPLPLAGLLAAQLSAAAAGLGGRAEATALATAHDGVRVMQILESVHRARGAPGGLGDVADWTVA